MSAAQLADWNAHVKAEYAAYNNFQKHVDGAKHSLAARKPYEHSKQVQAELAKLGTLTKKLHEIEAHGVGHGDKRFEDSAELFKMKIQMQVSAKDADHVNKEYLAGRAAMAGVTGRGEDLAETLEEISKSAGARKMLAVHIRDEFGKLMKATADNKIKAQFFENFEAFNGAEAALATTSVAADHAMKKINAGMAETRKKLEHLIKWHEEAVKEAAAKRK